MRQKRKRARTLLHRKRRTGRGGDSNGSTAHARTLRQSRGRGDRNGSAHDHYMGRGGQGGASSNTAACAHVMSDEGDGARLRQRKQAICVRRGDGAAEPEADERYVRRGGRGEKVDKMAASMLRRRCGRGGAATSAAHDRYIRQRGRRGGAAAETEADERYVRRVGRGEKEEKIAASMLRQTLWTRRGGDRNGNDTAHARYIGRGRQGGAETGTDALRAHSASDNGDRAGRRQSQQHIECLTHRCCCCGAQHMLRHAVLCHTYGQGHPHESS